MQAVRASILYTGLSGHGAHHATKRGIKRYGGWLTSCQYAQYRLSYLHTREDAIGALHTLTHVLRLPATRSLAHEGAPSHLLHHQMRKVVVDVRCLSGLRVELNRDGGAHAIT